MITWIALLGAAASCSAEAPSPTATSAPEPEATAPKRSSSSDDPTSSDAGAAAEAGTLACHAKTCKSYLAKCGRYADGCGGTVDCGTCAAPEKCTAERVCDVGKPVVQSRWTSANAFDLSGTSVVSALAWSPDGGRVAALGGPIVQVWSGSTSFEAVVGARAVTLAGSDGASSAVATYGFDRPTSLAFSPDGKTLALGAATGNGVVLQNMDANGTLTASSAPTGCSNGPANAVAFSPDGTRLLVGHSGSFDASGYPTVSLCTWGGLPVQGWSEKESTAYRVADVAFTPSGGIIAGLDTENAIAFFDSNLQPTGTTKIGSGTTGSLSQVAQTSEGIILALVGGVVVQPGAASGMVGAVAMNAHPKYARLALVGSDKVSIFNLHTQKVEAQVTHGAGLASVAWSPDGTKLATGGRGPSVIVWDVSWQ
jgi:WD40 repeat protein